MVELIPPYVATGLQQGRRSPGDRRQCCCPNSYPRRWRGYPVTPMKSPSETVRCWYAQAPGQVKFGTAIHANESITENYETSSVTNLPRRRRSRPLAASRPTSNSPRAGDVSHARRARCRTVRGPSTTVIVHGAGWRNGNKQLFVTPLFEPLTRRIRLFTINYRLAPAYHFPAPGRGRRKRDSITQYPRPRVQGGPKEDRSRESRPAATWSQPSGPRRRSLSCVPWFLSLCPSGPGGDGGG